jgi:tetratricopeptide (TPR) repeat protein
LARDKWRVLVDNLGMAYGISGDLANAKSTFEYGISKDGEYPNFHYNLACTYAETGKLDEAIASLRTAYKFKANVINGEQMPEARKDTSFTKFLDEPKFRKALAEIEGGQPR